MCYDTAKNMDFSWRQVLSAGAFAALARQYAERTHFGVALIGAEGVALNRCPYYPWARARRLGLDLDQMVHESLRWGEPNISLDRDGLYVWCVPVCLNSEIVAGLFSAVHPRRAAEERGSMISQAAWGLLELAVEANLSNASLMQVNREQGRANAYKADAIHSVKRNLFQNSREIYLQEEFGLLAAIRKGEKERARSIINRILIRIYSLQTEDLEILKTLVLEMVVLMYRTAVDKGADPRELLGVNSSYLKEFHEIQDDVSLSQWLTRWLEDFISISLNQVVPAPPDSVALAIEYIKNNLDQPISRDEVARACNMSYGYFSRIFRQRTGHTFSDLLNTFRVEQACALMDESSLNINQIALDCGFSDQSYFSKVFHRYVGATPKEYRRRAGAAQPQRR
jgi:AraC-like DNA-binding protein